jgi:hypothetical protein
MEKRKCRLGLGESVGFATVNRMARENISQKGHLRRGFEKVKE